MRLDLDAMARITAQLVKEEVERSAKTAPFDPTDLIARLDALEAENKALREAAVKRGDLDAVQERVDAQSKAIIDLKDADEQREASIKHGAEMDEARSQECTELADRINKSDEAFDNHLKDLIGRIKELESVEPVEPVNLDVIADQVLDQIKALIPQPLDEDGVVKRVIDHVDKALPPMIPAAPTPVDVDALRLSIEKGLPQRDAIEKDIKQMVEAMMPMPLGPTALQVIEGIKAVYPSIRQDMVKRLPAMEHKGVWNPDTSYDVGDEVIKNGSTYRLMEPSVDAPPSDSWQMVAQGSRGKQGKPGVAPTVDEVITALMSDPEIVKRLKGKDGVGVKDISMEGKTWLIEMTDGDVKTLDQTEFVELIIKALGE